MPIGSCHVKSSVSTLAIDSGSYEFVNWNVWVCLYKGIDGFLEKFGVGVTGRVEEVIDELGVDLIIRRDHIFGVSRRSSDGSIL
jgi:hypothetical protein